MRPSIQRPWRWDRPDLTGVKHALPNKTAPSFAPRNVLASALIEPGMRRGRGEKKSSQDEAVVNSVPGARLPLGGLGTPAASEPVK